MVVIEAASATGQDGFSFRAIQDLVGRLVDWRSSGLYKPRRYTVQLRITAASPDKALRRAVAYHDLAARAIGLTMSSVTRAEVLTPGEFESDGLLLATNPHPGRASLVAAAFPPLPSGSSGSGTPVVSDELYAATRGLLRASTVAEITEVVVRFVTAVGASVSFGEFRPAVGTVAVDISMGDGQPLHAIAEGASGAGLILERTLPSLVADAHAALRNHPGP